MDRNSSHSNNWYESCILSWVITYSSGYRSGHFTSRSTCTWCSPWFPKLSWGLIVIWISGGRRTCVCSGLFNMWIYFHLRNQSLGRFKALIFFTVLGSHLWLKQLKTRYDMGWGRVNLNSVENILFTEIEHT